MPIHCDCHTTHDFTPPQTLQGEEVNALRGRGRLHPVTTNAWVAQLAEAEPSKGLCSRFESGVRYQAGGVTMPTTQ